MKTKPVDIHGKPYHRGIMLAVILVAAFAGGLMQTSLSTALPTIMNKFNISLSTAQQATTWFSLASGIMVPLSAFLVNRFSVRNLHSIAYLILIIGVTLTVTTPETSSRWWQFVVGRVVAALAFGMLLPMMQIVILNIYGKKEQGLAMGLGGLVVGMSPAVGPHLNRLDPQQIAHHFRNHPGSFLAHHVFDPLSDPGDRLDFEFISHQGRFADQTCLT